MKGESFSSYSDIGRKFIKSNDLREQGIVLWYIYKSSKKLFGQKNPHQLYSMSHSCPTVIKSDLQKTNNYLH